MKVLWSSLHIPERAYFGCWLIRIAAHFTRGGRKLLKLSAWDCLLSMMAEMERQIARSGDRFELARSNQELDRALAPCTVQNFAFLTHRKYFDDTICHRLTAYRTPPAALSVLQCGDPLGSGWGDPGYSFKDELDSARALAAWSTPPGLRELRLQYNRIDESGAIVLAEAPALAQVTRFYFTKRAFRPAVRAQLQERWPDRFTFE